MLVGWSRKDMGLLPGDVRSNGDDDEDGDGNEDEDGDDDSNGDDEEQENSLLHARLYLRRHASIHTQTNTDPSLSTQTWLIMVMSAAMMGTVWPRSSIDRSATCPKLTRCGLLRRHAYAAFTSGPPCSCPHELVGYLGGGMVVVTMTHA